MEGYFAGPVRKESTTALKTQLLVNNMVVPLDDFTQQYIGNILRGISVSFGHGGKHVSIDINSTGLNLYSEDKDLHLENDFSQAIVESTIKGMLSPLRGVVWVENVVITTRE